jgi:hypothetical protein
MNTVTIDLKKYDELIDDLRKSKDLINKIQNKKGVYLMYYQGGVRSVYTDVECIKIVSDKYERIIRDLEAKCNAKKWWQFWK